MKRLTWWRLVVLIVAFIVVAGCVSEEDSAPATVPATESTEEPADEPMVEPEEEPVQQPEEDSPAESTTAPPQTSHESVRERIDPMPEKGFYWAYYLFIPATAYPSEGQDTKTFLLVEPNNTGHPTDDYATHDYEAQMQVLRSSMPYRLEVPLLVPVLPRPESKTMPAYTHALDRATLETDVSDLVRIDLQLLAMIDDAAERLAEEGIEVEEKVLMNGFSASAMFVNRFALLHPTEVHAAAIGSPGGWPLAPVGDWEGLTLDYPVGVADLENLVGEPFDADAFRSVFFYFFIGDQDTNDSVPGPGDSWLGWTKADVKLIQQEFGATPLERWPVAEEMYHSVESQAAFVVYPGAEHRLNETMLADVEAFFRSHIEAD